MNQLTRPALTAALLLAAVSACTRSAPSTGTLKDEAPATLRYTDFDARFTNPKCSLYSYPEDLQVVSNAGAPLAAKPQDVYCTQADSAVSSAQPEAPAAKLLSWINDPETRDIFLAYFSFSNSAAADALCRAISERGVKVTIVIDSGSDLVQANRVMACRPPIGIDALPALLTRGNTGGIGLAHDKLFIANPGAPTMKIAFSSGNLTSGLVLHHENWNFITLPSDTYFAQSHLCLMNGLISHADTTRNFRGHMDTCRAAIAAAPETDIKAYFVPADNRAAQAALLEVVQGAVRVEIAAHRFSSRPLIDALVALLNSNPEAEVHLVFDDDVYWTAHGVHGLDNTISEYNGIQPLLAAGAQVKYMQSNHKVHLLHHNKFIVATKADGTKVLFAGAGNFTGSGFRNNFENFYVVNIPAVTAAFSTQYAHLWDDLATSAEDLPSTPVFP